ncbi:hypothetical protein [Desulfotalea psychrophila]|uniref:Uncharacterized protein n=1 Tax=Desulfotalea psychrophila (strain LSv54 / DSM 12343) TaxID=177439 RepID=Q6ARW8_DESPS|nr:hypothetical protein [Desulfotalea psychrophila]CAG34907.1 unknown protein [Desulfotalea psychrophila LSv54]
MNTKRKAVPPQKVGAMGETASNQQAKYSSFPDNQQGPTDNPAASQRQRIFPHPKADEPTTDIAFTIITNHDGPLTKTIRPDGQGGIIKKPAANLVRGVTKRVTMPFRKFGPFLRTLQNNQALCHGVSDYPQANITSRAKFNGEPDTITRTSEYFHYPTGAGIGMFDHDPKPGQKTLSADELLDIIYSVCPDFRRLSTWWTPSTSSCIFDNNKNELTGIGAGFHLYFPFEPADKLPEFADWLSRQLWLAGHGHIFISRTGSLLTRTVFDLTVFSPERLDFVAGADCIDCNQRLPEPVYRKGLEVWA